MTDFNKEDVFILARAINDGPVSTSCGDFVTYLYCNYCDSILTGYQYAPKDFKHDVNCPVLVAQDVLTRN